MLLEPDRVRLQHMLDASEKALAFMQGRTRPDLETDQMLSLALVRLLEVIGEAARAVSQELKNSYPAVPWRQIAGTRDRLIHGYFDVDLDIVWAILSGDLPALAESIRQILR